MASLGRSEDASPHREPIVKRRRPVLLAAAAMTAVAVVSLSACGGGDDGGGSKSGDEKIEGAGQGDEESSSPSPSEAASAKRPAVKLPTDLQYDIEWDKTGDKGKDAVLSDTEQYLKAVDVAVAEQDPAHKAYRFYSEGEAAAGSQKFIEEFVDHKDRIAGTKRFFNAKVNVTGGTKASIVYCEDQGKAFNKSLKTGKTDKGSAQPSKDDLVIYSSRLHRDKQGVWITEQTTSERGSAACQE
ncbi:hypothetical protein GCM10012286_57700 [Streptomyces lasiicapitis]|uniref:Lipoprotein n=1 Tax=Streptomyces lasiicapitis TaxID=1923961 RepID=A0ABQ2MH81_9ACTN|nr:hypothetical protein GCM10012286_57700 [Streptomyces lasiicapitis]